MKDTPSIVQFLGNTARRLASGLNLTSNEEQRVDEFRGSLEKSRLDANERIESLKSDLRTKELRQSKLAQEYENERFASAKSIVLRQLEMACGALEKTQQRTELLFANLMASESALGKIDELLEARLRGISVEAADSLAVELELAVENYSEAESALAGAERVQFKTRSGTDPFAQEVAWPGMPSPQSQPTPSPAAARALCALRGDPTLAVEDPVA